MNVNGSDMVMLGFMSAVVTAWVLVIVFVLAGMYA